MINLLYLKSLIKEPTCYKKPEKPNCIDLILTNFPRKSLIKEPTCYKNPEKPTCLDLILANSPTQLQST